MECYRSNRAELCPTQGKKKKARVIAPPSPNQWKLNSRQMSQSSHLQNGESNIYKYIYNTEQDA